MYRRYAVAAALVLLCTPSLALAQWIPDGNPVSTAPDQQNYSRVIGDTEGGVIVAWTTNVQGGVNYDLFIERYDGFGQRLWSTGGVTVAALNNNQWKPALAPDDSGGVYVAWEDNRAGNYDIYAQHFDKDGNELWGANGLVVCNDAADQGGASVQGPQIVRSNHKNIDRGSTGVIICWQDNRNAGTTKTDIYAQRIDNVNGAMWTANGVLICGATESQGDPQMVVDDSNGAIIAWRDARSGIGADDIYAQRVGIAGAVQWTTDGEPVCVQPNDQVRPRALADGSGGVYVSWIDRRIGLLSPFALYVQRLDGSGSPLWTVNGVNIYGFVEYDEAELVPDDTGGAIVCWRDTRNGLPDIFAQRLTANGTKRWTANGVTACNRAGDDKNHRVSRDGEGGLYTVWDNGGFPILEAYIQRLDSTGVATFAADGRLVTNAADRQYQPDVCVDGGEPAFVSWTDYRNSSNNPDVYLTRIYHTVSGVEPPSAAAALRVRAYPNPFNTATQLSIATPGAGSVSVDIYDVAGRLVARRTVVAGPGGEASLSFDGRGDEGRALPSGVYLARVRASGLTTTAKIVLMR